MDPHTLPSEAGTREGSTCRAWRDEKNPPCKGTTRPRVFPLDGGSRGELILQGGIHSGLGLKFSLIAQRKNKRKQSLAEKLP